MSFVEQIVSNQAQKPPKVAQSSTLRSQTHISFIPTCILALRFESSCNAPSSQICYQVGKQNQFNSPKFLYVSALRQFFGFFPQFGSVFSRLLLILKKNVLHRIHFKSCSLAGEMFRISLRMKYVFVRRK